MTSSKKLSSRERVRAAVNHQQPDTTPFLAFLTGEVSAKLSEIYGLSDKEQAPPSCSMSVSEAPRVGAHRYIKQGKQRYA